MTRRLAIGLAFRLVALIAAVVILVPVFAQDATPGGDEAATPDLRRGWYARITTDLGEIVVRLLPEQAPQSVAHFAALAEGRLSWIDPFTGNETGGHYYDGVVVHKVELAQRFETGDRTGTGRGSPPLYVPAEGGGPINFHQGNVVGMTRAPLGRISAVQFFVTVTPQPWLTGRHPCFGEVVSGREVAFEITAVPHDSAGKPKKPVHIQEIRIFKVGEVGPLPEPVPYTPKVEQLGRKDE
jgi:peptidyl-prolyl cis-trans isomerase A (cyclophilin A)